MTAAELETYLYDQIPLSKAMAVHVVDPGPARVVLEAPLESNTNHRSTAFGGSVSTLATLAGWALVHRRLRERGHPAKVVIQRGSTEFVAPVTTGFRATCETVDATDWGRILSALERFGKARIRTRVLVEASGEVVARFEGSYVALERPAA